MRFSGNWQSGAGKNSPLFRKYTIQKKQAQFSASRQTVLWKKTIFNFAFLLFFTFYFIYFTFDFFRYAYANHAYR